MRQGNKTWRLPRHVLQGKRRRSEVGKEEGRRWSAAELKSLEERLIALGAGRTAELQQQV